MSTTPSAIIVADSISPDGMRLTTFEVTMHRFVLAEFNTHRVFSRNSASSRAIPVLKQLERVEDDPAFPIKWPAERPGMQGGAELTGRDLARAQELFSVFQIGVTGAIRSYLADVADHYGLSWESDDPAEIAELKSHTLHKSLLNRLIEPIMWHKVIVTAVEWQNFYEQRVSPLAQPEIEVAAAAMLAISNSTPRQLGPDDWHVPYIGDVEKREHPPLEVRQVSVARCARVSSLQHDGVRDWSKDLDLYAKLMAADPKHWSPTEHVATPYRQNTVWVLPNIMSPEDFDPYPVPVIGNFAGWRQMRHEFKTWSTSKERPT